MGREHIRGVVCVAHNPERCYENITGLHRDGKVTGEKRRAKLSEDAISGGASDPQAISNRGHVAQLRDFVTAIQQDRELMIPATEARKPVELILAIYESAKTGKRVKLPFRPKPKKK